MSLGLAVQHTNSAHPLISSEDDRCKPRRSAAMSVLCICIFLHWRWTNYETSLISLCSYLRINLDNLWVPVQFTGNRCSTSSSYPLCMHVYTSCILRNDPLLEGVIERTWPLVDPQAKSRQLEVPHPSPTECILSTIATAGAIFKDTALRQ